MGKFFTRINSLGQNIDPFIITILIIIAFYGCLMVYSATGADPGYVERKITQVIIGLVLCVLVANLSTNIIDSVGLPFLIVTCLLLAITLKFGETSKGATRWLNLGVARFQPSELAKIAVPLYLSIYLGSKEISLNLRTLVISGIILAVPTLLIILEPDLGTSILVILSGLIVIFLAGLSWKIIILALVITICAAPIFWEYGMHDYQRTRVLTILNPDADPLGAGYHVIQSKIAIGSGGIMGKGILEGTQVQLNFLPEPQTDFIFSVLSEEFGLVGVTILFILYFCLIARLFWLGSLSQNATSRLICSSQGFIFSIYIIVNVGMVSGLLPVVGVPLPLMSYGGTSFISLCLTLGLAMGYFNQRQGKKKSFKQGLTTID